MRPLTVRRLVAAVVLGAALAGPAPAAAEVAGIGSDGVWLVSDDGTTRTKVADREVGALDWSPDGERLLLSVFSRGAYRLLAGPPGGPYTEIPGSDDLIDPAWSPDGTRIAAVREGAVVLLPAAGGTPTTVTSGAKDRTPAWSPDGAELVFARDAASPLEHNTLHAVRVDGTGLRTLTRAAVQPDWSPDGTRIAYASDRDQNGSTCAGGESDDCQDNHEIYVIGADGTGERRLTDSIADDVEPAWAPDGSRIAFATDVRSVGPELFVMDPDGSCQTQLTAGTPTVAAPAWRPGRLPVGRGPCGVRLASYLDTVDLAAFRLRDADPLFPGRRFGGMRPGGAAGRYLVYEECDPREGERCVGPLTLTAYTTCARNPARFPLRAKRIEAVRGALLLHYPDGRAHLISGGTLMVIEAERGGMRLHRRIARALRPARRPDARPRRLAAPQLPPEAWTRLATKDRRVLVALRKLRGGRRPACAR